MSLYLGENLISGSKPINLGVRNIGEVFPAILPVTDAGAHLLDGSLILGGGIYQEFVDYIADLYDISAKYSNVTKIGSLTDNNGVLSNISISNYATANIPFSSLNQTWEVVIKCNPSVLANYTVAGTGYSWAINVDTKPILWLSSDNSSWNITENTSGVTSLQTGTDYWFKLVFTGTQYVLYSSTTGAFNGEQVTEITINSTTPVYSGNTITLGKWHPSFTGGSFQGSIDLNECYININGSRWWSGRNAYGFTDEPQWQSSVSTYGSCGKFVYDSTNNTVRLPKVSDILQGTTDLTALGDLVASGLPQHTHTRGSMNITGNFAIDKTSYNWADTYVLVHFITMEKPLMVIVLRNLDKHLRLASMHPVLGLVAHQMLTILLLFKRHLKYSHKQLKSFTIS